MATKVEAKPCAAAPLSPSENWEQIETELGGMGNLLQTNVY